MDGAPLTPASLSCPLWPPGRDQRGRTGAGALTTGVRVLLATHEESFQAGSPAGEVRSVDVVTNREILEVIEPNTYLHAYLEYAACQTDAPFLYHIGCGLAALAAVMPPTVRIWHHGHWCYGNLWIMLVGNSGRDRKTTAIRLATDLIKAVNPELLGTPPGSSQGLQESLIENPYQLIAFEELGSHLAQTRNRGMEDIRTTMNMAYDGGPIGRSLAAGTKQADIVRLSVLGGVTPSYLESYTDETARTGGYLNRYGMMLARREHHLASVIPDEGRRVVAARWLQSVHSADCPEGAIGFTDEAKEIWEKWGQGVEYGVQHADQEISGTVSRAQEFALKVALLLSVASFKHNPKSFWPIDAPALRLAIKIAGWHVRGADYILHNLCASNFQRNRRKLVTFLEGTVKTRGQIQRYMQMSGRDVDQLLDALKREGRIQAQPKGIHPAWKLLSIAETEAEEAKEMGGVDAMAAAGVAVLGVPTPPATNVVPLNGAKKAKVKPNGSGAPIQVQQMAGADVLPRVAASTAPAPPVDPEDYNDAS